MTNTNHPSAAANPWGIAGPILQPDWVKRLKSLSVPNIDKVVMISNELKSKHENLLLISNRLNSDFYRLDAIANSFQKLAELGPGISDALNSSGASSMIHQLEEIAKSISAVKNSIPEPIRLGAYQTEIYEVIKDLASGQNSAFKSIEKNFGRIARFLPDSQKSVIGAEVKQLKAVIEAEVHAARENALGLEEERRLAAERVDATLPAPPRPRGRIHPVSQVFEEVTAIFSAMGFSVAEGPDIEDDFHNFTALNFPPRHPARDMHDTFFFNPKEDGSRMLLRTHTSPVQIRTMMSTKPPIRVIIPGRTYRCDSDQTHTPMFHQLEGLVIEEGIHMGHLKGVLMDFVAAFFEVDDVEARFRPHHFPFTEPSAEMDVRCDRSGGELKIGQGTDWLEILGCGMVHPNVLRACGLDPAVHQGFAFGLGVDRLAMLKYGMPDLRDMFAADVRWLDHYGFEPMVAPNLATGLS